MQSLPLIGIPLETVREPENVHWGRMDSPTEEGI